MFFIDVCDLTKVLTFFKLQACNFCSKTKIGIDSFKIVRKCRSDYDTKIHEALLIKKHSLGLNRQLYASGASFLLQVF